MTIAHANRRGASPAVVTTAAAVALMWAGALIVEVIVRDTPGTSSHDEGVLRPAC